MIFTTVGTQLPFHRLIDAIDIWSLEQDVRGCFAQIGNDGNPPQNMQFSNTLDPAQFANQIAKCKVVVSHAGIGTILTALQYGKPIIVMPRLAKYGEHRNDHQLATVSNLEGRAGIHVAHNEHDLKALLNKAHDLGTNTNVTSAAEPELIQAIDSFIGARQTGIIYA